MKAGMALLALASAACASAQGGPERPAGRAFSVAEVIYRQQALIGTRVVIRGRLSRCQPLSCTLHGKDGNGRERFLSIGRSAVFDAAAGRYSGRSVEIEALLTDHCLADPDPDLIALCADRASTLVDPIFLRAL